MLLRNGTDVSNFPRRRRQTPSHPDLPAMQYMVRYHTCTRGMKVKIVSNRKGVTNGDGRCNLVDPKRSLALRRARNVGAGQQRMRIIGDL